MSSGTAEKEGIARVYFGLAIEAQRQIPSNLQGNKKRVIVIAGPTGCGKSDFSLMLANKIGGEVISADSMQVYRGMDIGTAKPTTSERALVPHYLIDIREIEENFNVVDFYYEARQSIQTVLSRGAVPIVVGGSGFYLHALIYGPPSGPPAMGELRKALTDEMEKMGVDALYERLRSVDPEYAKSVTRNDKQKIIRALEIVSLTGKKVSKMSWKHRTRPLNYDFRCWFLNRSKEALYRRIEKRCDKMIENGLISEVEALKSAGLEKNSSAMQAIGYRQVLDYLKTERTEADYHVFMEEFKKASRHYAKRQITWFRKEPLFRWLDLEVHDYEVAIDIINQDYLSL